MKSFLKSLFAVFMAGNTTAGAAQAQTSETRKATPKVQSQTEPDSEPLRPEQSEKFEGRWELYAYAHLESDLLGGKDEVDPSDIQAWLLGDGGGATGNTEDASGSTLLIHGSGRIHEQAESLTNILWFDDEGVQENYNSIAPFIGFLVENANGVFARPDKIASWAVPDNTAYQARLRYDDYDTLISERFDVNEAELSRTLNVVTDGLYVTRIVMFYRKSGET